MLRKFSLVAATVVGCLAASNSAHASCYYHSVYGYICSTTYGPSCTSKRPSVEGIILNEQVATKAIVRIMSNAITNTMARNMFNFLAQFAEGQNTGYTTGMAAGDGLADGMSLWGSVDYTNVDMTPKDSTNETKDSNIMTGVFGLDKAFNDRLVAGAAFSLGASNMDGKNTNGTDLTEDSRSFTVAPYVGYAFNQNFTVDATLGLTLSNVDIEDRNSGAPGVSETNATTGFAAVNLNYMRQLNDMLGMKAFTGYSVMKTSVDSHRDSLGNYYTDSESAHWQARIGASLMAAVTEKTELYGTATYERDKRTIEVEENAGRLSFGINQILSDSAILTFEGTGTVARESQRELGASASLRYSF